MYNKNFGDIFIDLRTYLHQKILKEYVDILAQSE